MGAGPAFEDLIAKTYTAAMDHDEWAPMLDCTAEFFGAVGASFEIFDKNNGNPLFLKLGSSLKQVDAPEYIDYYAGISPRVQFAQKVRSGDVSYDYAILSETDLNNDEFYSDCLGPMGLRYFLAGHILDVNGHLGAFAVQRSEKQGHVDTEEVLLMQRLLPHIQQAVDVKYRLANARFGRDRLLEGIEHLAEAVILINENGEVLHANKIAETIFRAGDGIRVEDKRLSCLQRSATRRLDMALGNTIARSGEETDCIGKSIIVRRPSGARPYVISVRRLPLDRERPVFSDAYSSAIVFIRDPGEFNYLDLDSLVTSYGLSPKEAETAVALDQGHSIKKIARRRGVGPTTVRSQVYALMAKLFVSRQVDLIRVLGQYRRPFN